MHITNDENDENSETMIACDFIIFDGFFLTYFRFMYSWFDSRFIFQAHIIFSVLEIK